MNAESSSGGGGILAGIAVLVAILVIIGGMIYMIGDLSAQRARSVADAESSRAQIAQAQVEIARAHEEGSTERMQVFALTLKSLTAENQMTITLLSVGVLILGILQLVQTITRPRGGA
jgi:uncharacterized membrane protein YraQ (UPF0718 family)